MFSVETACGFAGDSYVFKFSLGACRCDLRASSVAKKQCSWDIFPDPG
jgi:hypothetical protein